MTSITRCLGPEGHTDQNVSRLAPPPKVAAFRFSDVSTLPVIVIALDGVIDSCLSNIVRSNESWVVDVLRKRPVDRRGN